MRLYNDTGCQFSNDTFFNDNGLNIRNVLLLFTTSAKIIISVPSLTLSFTRPEFLGKYDNLDNLEILRFHRKMDGDQ